MAEWQPIETAPDRKDILIVAPDVVSGVTIAFFKRGKLYSSFDGKPFQTWVTPPSHWMPLPPPPTETSNG